MVAKDEGLAEPRSNRSGSAEAPAKAFASLLDGSLGRSYRLATVLLGSQDQAEEATQDAAIRAWRHFGSLREPSRFDAWFGRILLNVCRDRLAARARTVVEIPMSGAVPDLETAEPQAWSAERGALRAALDRLGPDHRVVIVLRYLEDLTVEQIADRTGTRPGTVKSRLHYALQELRAAYDASGRNPKENIR